MVRLYYTGAMTYLQEQKVALKSIGGFISSSPVQNGVFEGFFSDLSELSISENLPESKMFALKNEGNTQIKNLKLYYVYPENNLLKIFVSAIKPSLVNTNQFAFEKLQSIRSSPVFSQDFFEADSQFASAKVYFSTPAEDSEVITILGVSTTPAPSALTLEETYKLVETAFKNNLTYTCQYKSVSTESVISGDFVTTVDQYLLFQKKVVGVFTSPVTFSTTGTTLLKQPVNFSGGFDNSINLGDLGSGEYLGIWFRKEIQVDSIKSQPVVSKDKMATVLGQSENIQLFFEW